jgi:hypothetical protein
MDDESSKSLILSTASFKVVHRADASVMGAPVEGVVSSPIGLDLQITSASWITIPRIVIL